MCFSWVSEWCFCVCCGLLKAPEREDQKYNSSDALRANKILVKITFWCTTCTFMQVFYFMPFSNCNSYPMQITQWDSQYAFNTAALTAGLFSLLELKEKELVQDRGCFALDGPSGRKLLTEILEEVKAARQNVKTEQANTGPGYYRRVAEIIDAVFFAFYLITIITFMSVMYVLWFGQYVE